MNLFFAFSGGIMWWIIVGAYLLGILDKAYLGGHLAQWFEEAPKMWMAWLAYLLWPLVALKVIVVLAKRKY